MFQHLGRITAKYPWTICACWLILGVTLACTAPHWDARTQDDDIRFFPDRFTSVRAYQLLEQAFPQDVFASRVVFAVERDTDPLSEHDYELVNRLVADLETLRRDAPELKIGKIDSYRDGLVGARLISPDQQCTLIQVSLGSPYLAVSTLHAVDRAEAVAKKRVSAAGDHAPNLYTTGVAGVGRDLTKACGNSLEDTTWATVLLVIVVLLAVYRAPVMALIPLITIACSVWVALNLLAMMTLLPGVQLVNISKIFAIVILYGAGTDYCLFLISRYREELEDGQETAGAIARGVGGVGEALVASAGTVMVGLGLMALAEFAKVRYAGPAIAISLGVALLASLTLTPALLSLTGAAAFWPRRPPRFSAKDKALRQMHLRLGFWDWVSRGVARRPVLVLSVATLILAPLVFFGLRVPSNYRATGELSPHAESLRGLAAIQRHFTAGDVGPVTVLLATTADWDSGAGQRQIDHLSRGFASLPNVAEVRSLTQPLGMPLIDLTPDPERDCLVTRLLILVQPIVEEFRSAIHAQAKEHYVASAADRSVTRLDIILKSDPFEPESAATLKLIRTWLAIELPRFNLIGKRIQAECFGITACAQDLAEVTEGDRLRVNGLVLASVFLILLLLIRRLVLSIYLLLTTLASYYAALGATVLAGVLWTGAPLATVDWRVPFFLFVILVAVGEDYNILLVSRALQERKRHGSFEGMRRALAKTGAAITSCGLIMAGTFGTLMLAGLNTLIQIGFALAVGVLIDTFVVRPFLVPAFAMLWWHEAKDPAAAASAPKSVSRKKPALERIAQGEWKQAA
ncbi:MAG: MMPL family transporter [Gemmataceae bacterium]|nr:MMPL family transporter [Gemmataceae bacterium]